MNITKGQRLPLAQIVQNNESFQIAVNINSPGLAVDFACFGLDAAGKLSDDRYMTFFNQPETPCGGIKLCVVNPDPIAFQLCLHQLPPSIDRLMITASIDGQGTMQQIHDGYLRFLCGNQESARFTFTGTDFQQEKALMLGELYRKDGEWRFIAFAQGFNGGLEALVKYFGGEVAETTQAATAKISLEKKIAAQAPKLVDLAKKATISLEKHHLTSTTARVGLILDASGSMHNQYNTGKVQSVIERLLPLAVHFDDDAALDVWAFSTRPLALPEATLENYADYINSVERGWRNWGMMGVNNEPLVIQQVIEHYQDSRLPVLIIFVSDGGVSQNSKIKQLLTDAARLPIFWQFVGIGGRNYGVLEKLDTLSGRIVDNCGFFALDDLNSVSEQVLYDRLLSEFPLWHQAAKAKNIVN